MTVCCCFGSCGCCDEEQKPAGFRPVDAKHRSCTDVFPLILFICFCIGMMVVGVFAFSIGDGFKILYGVDSFGNTCGRKNSKLAFIGVEPDGQVFSGSTKQYVPNTGIDARNKKFLYALDYGHPFDSVWICVESCPTVPLTEARHFSDMWANGTSLCQYDYNASDYHLITDRLMSNVGPCAVLPTSPTQAILNRCVPNDIISMATGIVHSTFGTIKDIDYVRQVAHDLILVWREMLFVCLCALLASLFLVFLIRFCAPVVVYLIYAIVAAVGIGIAGSMWYWWYQAGREADQFYNTSAPFGMTEGLQPPNAWDARILLALAVSATVFSVLLLVVVWCLWPRGTLIVNLFKQAGKALQKMPFLLFQPIISTAVLLTFVTAWSVVGIYLYTAADPTITALKAVQENAGTQVVPTIKSQMPPFLRYICWYHVFGLIWIAEFIFAAQRMIIAGAIACWYFARDRNSIGQPVVQSTWTLFRYHLGSIAFGSLIITMVKLPRYIVMYTYAKLKVSQHWVVRYLLACVIALLACIEKCLRYIHHNAYTVIAISGDSFCPATKTATNIILDNAVNVATINSVGDFVLLLAKGMVSISMGAFAGYMFKSNPNVEHWVIPTVICAVISYFIANCFLSVFEMIVDTLFLCYAEETAMVSRSNGSHDYADYEFRDFMNSTLKRERNLRRAGSESFEMENTG